MFVHELVRQGEPDAIAIKEYGQDITYRELAERTAACQSRLYAAGVRQGMNVAIFSRNSSAYIIASMAIAALGAVAVPLNFQLSPRETAFILKDAEVHFLLTDRELHLRDALKAQGCPEAIAQLSLADLCKDDHALPAIPYAPSIDENAPCLIIYTSGTTGAPKGAVLSHKNVTTNAWQIAERLSITAEDNVLCVLPMYHCYGWTAAVLTPLYAGAAITTLASFQPKETIQTIREARVTVIHSVPSIASLVMKLGRESDLATVRLTVIGGTALPDALAIEYEKKFRQKPTEAYGLSEASPVVTLNVPGKERRSSIGLPMKGVETRIVDSEGRSLPPGECGELLVKGDIVMLGYWRRPEATAETIQDGWLHTGDIARADEDGFLYLVDRIKDMIISMGENIYPREIEELIYHFPGVMEAAVIGVPDKIRGQAGACFYSAKEGESVDVRALKKYLRENLALFKIPREFHELPALPRTATGKIAKRELRKPEFHNSYKKGSIEPFKGPMLPFSYSLPYSRRFISSIAACCTCFSGTSFSCAIRRQSSYSAETETICPRYALTLHDTSPYFVSTFAMRRDASSRSTTGFTLMPMLVVSRNRMPTHASRCTSSTSTESKVAGRPFFIRIGVIHTSLAPASMSDSDT